MSARETTEHFESTARQPKSGITRRSFLAGSVLLALATGTGLTACSSGESTSNNWQPETWDAEADFVIVGYGSAGAAAAITANKEDLGDVIVLEAAPPEYEGGNSRVCGQIIFESESPESAYAYQKDLNGPYPVEDELLKAWSEGILENYQWFEELGGSIEPIKRAAEFAEATDAAKVKICCVDGEYGNGSLWYFLKSQQEEFGFQVINSARVTKLVRNPLTNEACGAYAEKEDGTTMAVKARKAVIVSCGGFENNPELVRTYYQIGTPTNSFLGTPFNRGDGFALVAPFGAQLWHMNSYSGGHLSSMAIAGEPFATTCKPAGKGWIFVGGDNTRFMYEETNAEQRHGKLRSHGAWVNFLAPDPIHMIMGAKAFDEAETLVPKGTLGYASQTGYLDDVTKESFINSGAIVKADTIEELAEKLGRDPKALADTVTQYNGYCTQGVDPDFGRGEPYYEFGKTGIGGGDEAAQLATEKVAIIEPFALEPLEGPFYAIEMRASFINTQGGPKRNANCQMVDSDDNPLPRLYGAGEFGAIYSYQYNGGGNISEALATGRTAVRHAATLDPWDAKK